MRWLCLLLLILSAPRSAAAGVLLKGVLEGEPVQIELGADPRLAVITLRGERGVMSLPDAPIEAAAEYRLKRWTSGPVVAGYGTTYHVLTLDASICGEVLAAAWMTPFLTPAVRAIAELQKGDRRLRPKARAGCGTIPFAAYAGAGFPLLAGWKDAAVFTTTELRFDHPPPPELAPTEPAAGPASAPSSAPSAAP